MTSIRIIDLDGSLVPQTALFDQIAAEWIPAREWEPRIRLACPFRTFDRFRDWLHATMTSDDPRVTLYGSGDFHHVTLALLHRIREPFNLLVLDKHPDWMRGIPFLHCGTWLRHALRLPELHSVYHCGGETDFDNAYRWLAPWSEITAGRIRVFPARRHFAGRRWSAIPMNPLLREDSPLTDRLPALLEPHRAELRRFPLYVSIDKDVLCPDDAAVNWDSGYLAVDHALAIVSAFRAAACGRLVGADILGDWSPVRLGHWLNRLCVHLDHPSPIVEPSEAALRNARANAALLRSLTSNGPF